MVFGLMRGQGWGRGSTYSQQGKGVGMQLGKSVCVCERVTRPEWKVEEGKGVIRKDCLPSLLPTHPCHDLEITCCWVPVIASKGRAHRVSCYSYFNRVGSCPCFLYFRRIVFRFGETTTFTRSPEGLPRISVSVHLMLQRDLGSWRCCFAS